MNQIKWFENGYNSCENINVQITKDV